MSSAISLANWSFQFLSTVYGQTSGTWVGLKIVYTPFEIISLVYHHNGMDITEGVYIHVHRKMHEGSPQHLSNIAWVTGCRGVRAGH